MLMGAARVAVSDGVLTDAERQALTELGARFGLTPVHVSGILSTAQAASRHANG
jgi:tellurite resistance protein